MSTAKANNYLQLLDAARCNGDWASIPELCRKIKKHAPGRKCLTLVAETEERIRLLPTPSKNAPAAAITSYNAQLDELRDRLLDEIESYPNPLLKLPTPAGGGRSTVTTELDILQAKITAAWISSLKNDWAEVLVSIPGEDEVGEGCTGNEADKSDYMDIMRLKALVLKGLALSHTNADSSHALQLYRAATRLPASFSAPVQNCAIFRVWAEKALAHYALAAYHFWVEEHAPASSPVAITAPASPTKLEVGSEASRPATAGGAAQEPVGVAIGKTLVDNTTVASAFRGFHKFLTSGAGGSRPSTATRHASKEILRRSVYMNYFKFLSLILLPKNHPRRPATPVRNTPSPLPHESTLSVVSTRNRGGIKGLGTEEQLRAELKEIQLIYERYLLNGLPYPKADEYHEIIGEWVDQVVENWRASGGTGEDAAPVVEVLYRASQKTFHSPRILRHLFFTLTATGNFRDATAALKTYLDLVEKAKERMQKGQKEADFDSDKTVFATAVDGIRVLCKFIGSGEKAMDVARRIEKWTTTWRIREKYILEEAHRGIGMANATWARQVPDGDQREGTQEEAVAAFKKALSYDPYDIQAWYGAALVEAELGRVDDAIESVRRGLGALKCNYLENDDVEYSDGGAREYKRWAVPLLHLLALLKTAKEDFDDAEKVCRNAFDIVGDGREAVSDFGVTDKVFVFELMMTRLAITEAVDDPEAAIAMADGLIGLYGMLFDGTHLVQRFDLGTMEGAVSRPTTTASRRSRLFGRHNKQFSSSVTSLPPQSEVPSQTPSRSGTLKKQRPKSGHQSLDGPIGLEQTTPKIQVTGTSDGASTPNSKSNRKSMRSSSVSGGTVRRMRSLGSIRLKSEVKPDESPTPPLPSSTETSSLSFGGSDRQNGRDPHLFHMLKSKLHRHQLQQASDSAAASSTSIVSAAAQNDGTAEGGRSGETRVEDLPNNLPQKKLPLPLGAISRIIPADREGETPRSLKRPSQLPEPKLAVEEERRQVLGVLRKAWLCVAGLYRRAGHLGDAAMAVEEANGLITTDGDGEADVLAEKGYLALANDKKTIAADYFETAIAIDYDHPQAIIGLTKLLLAEITEKSTERNDASSRRSSTVTTSSSSQPEEEEDEDAVMDRLAARDRCLGLLERLVWSPRGWNISEAHYLLSQAHEKAGEIEKAKAALWTVVELEDGTGVRGWSSCGVGIV